MPLYNATGEANWTSSANWLTDAPVGQWHGVTTNASGRVSRLELQNNALSGQIPVELGSLTNLEQLRLNDNQLTGEIPNGLGLLENLTMLHLSGNQLTGCVPAALMDVEDNDFARLGLPFCGVATATRSFSTTTVAPGRQVMVTITAADYGGAGQVVGDPASRVRLRIQQSLRGSGHGHRPAGPGGNVRADRRDILHLHRYRIQQRGSPYLLRHCEGF